MGTPPRAPSQEHVLGDLRECDTISAEQVRGSARPRPKPSDLVPAKSLAATAGQLEFEPTRSKHELWFVGW